MNLKELTKKPSRFAPGHRTCQGCPIPVIVRAAMRAADSPLVAGCATGCLQVTSTIFPQTSWEVPYIHSAFENVAATLGGVEAAYEFQLKMKTNKALLKPGSGVKFIAFAGDGATYDIGFQSLSAVAERGHNLLYICYDNQAYMNTGIQRSSATPKGSWTTTSPVGKKLKGKMEMGKPLTEIMVAHRLPYVAQASPSHILDLYNKVRKALGIKGLKFINVISPCPLGWKFDSSLSIKLANLAVETRFWPLYEVENGKYRVNASIEKPRSLKDFLKPQGRFNHFFTEGGKKLLTEMEVEVQKRWEELKAKES